MSTVELPLQELMISIGIKTEKGPDPEAGQKPVRLSYDWLDADLLRRLAPVELRSWLFCDAYDAYDIARLACEAGFTGRYVAVAADLPDPGAIAREIRGCFPGLNFRLLCPERISDRTARYRDFIASATQGAQLAPA